MCGLPERVELQTKVGTTGESRVTDQYVNYWREWSYRPVCELLERVELQTSVNYWRELSDRPVCELPERVKLQTSV